ncbi:MAG TPA: hypothetical protein VFG79_03655 [Solirubrobacter sp.]|nr:hypothetical protein [Solirubrobacter sp.]
MRRRPNDVLAAGLAASALSGVPSTAWTLIERGDVLEGARAVGRMVLPRERRTVVLLAAGAPVHLGLSLGWAAVLAAALPPHDEPALGALGGLAIAALDLKLLGPRFPPIRALPQGRQWADHVAFGLTVGVVLRATRRAGRRPAPGGAAR